MSDEKKIGVYLRIFNKIKELFPGTKEKHFRLNLCFDAFVILCVLLEKLGSCLTHLIYAISSILKSWILNTNISEYYHTESSIIVLVFIAIGLCVLCFAFVIWYDAFKEKGYGIKNVKKE